MKSFIFLILGLALFLIPLLASSQVITIENPLKYNTFKDLIVALIDFLTDLALIIAPMVIIIAAFYFVTSAGDPKKISTAKSAIFYAGVGLIIVLLAKGIIALIKTVIGVK